MTAKQKIEIKNMLDYFTSLKVEELEPAFNTHWKPFIKSLKTEDDQNAAFQIFYEWQIQQMNTLANHISQLPIPDVRGSKKPIT